MKRDEHGEVTLGEITLPRGLELAEIERLE